MASSILSDIASYLTPDEKVAIVGNSQKEVYVTNKRLIIKKRGVFGGKEIVDASYRHISSIEYEKKIPLRYIVTGVSVIVFGLLLSYFSPLITQGWF